MSGYAIANPTYPAYAPYVVCGLRVTNNVYLTPVITGQTGVTAYAISGAVTALCGAAISTRHVWIQHLPPDKVPECGPGLDYVLQNFPLFETVKLMLSGTGDCAKVDWTLLGFSMPAWTLLAFLMLASLSLLQIWNDKQAK